MKTIKKDVKAEIFFGVMKGRSKRLVKELIKFDGSDLGLIQSIESLVHKKGDPSKFDFFTIEKIERLTEEAYKKKYSLPRKERSEKMRKLLEQA
tara:strand:- start:409 stop:690 length:282 start_codon:yes stop_codon:yes gene_type:complete